MPRTMILEPLSENDLDENVAHILKKALERIRTLLDSIKEDETMTFVEFLEKLDLSEQQYIKAIRLSLKHSTLLLKRSPAEIRINCYNPHLLKAWQANMDIQFVLDPYACTVYILTYITKVREEGAGYFVRYVKKQKMVIRILLTRSDISVTNF